MSTRVIDRQLGASGTTFHKGEVWNDADYKPDFHSQAGLAILDIARSRRASASRQ